MMGAQSGVDTPPSKLVSFAANGLVKENEDCVTELGGDAPKLTAPELPAAAGEVFGNVGVAGAAGTTSEPKG